MNPITQCDFKCGGSDFKFGGSDFKFGGSDFKFGGSDFQAHSVESCVLLYC